MPDVVFAVVPLQLASERGARQSGGGRQGSQR
jgi:hypothetical protein